MDKFEHQQVKNPFWFQARLIFPKPYYSLEIIFETGIQQKHDAFFHHAKPSIHTTQMHKHRHTLTHKNTHLINYQTALKHKPYCISLTLLPMEIMHRGSKSNAILPPLKSFCTDWKTGTISSAFEFLREARKAYQICMRCSANNAQ